VYNTILKFGVKEPWGHLVGKIYIMEHPSKGAIAVSWTKW
jgi:hypothetical protein